MGLGALVLDRLRHRRIARVAVVPAALLYSFVLGNRTLGWLGVSAGC